MHDFHIAHKIVKIIKDYQQKNNIKKISRVLIELGGIMEHGEMIKKENLEFNIKMLLKDDNIKVKIQQVEGDSWELKEIEGE